MLSVSWGQVCPMYFSWETKEAEMLSGRVAHPTTATARPIDKSLKIKLDKEIPKS